MKVIAVTVCRNEENFIGKAIYSVLSQKVPIFYVVVDDASTDKTLEIIKEFKDVMLLRMKESGIKDYGMRIFTGFTRGVKLAEKHVPDWEYLVKVDADSVLPSTYIASLIHKMEKNSKIGIASGVPFTKTKFGYEKMDIALPTDGARVYRRECWDVIGGLYPIFGSDTQAVFDAMRLGWQVRSFDDVPYFEMRPWGRESWYFWFTRGSARYIIGYPLTYAFLDALKHIKNKLRPLGPIIALMTYLIYHLTPWRRVFSKEYYYFVNRYMLDKVRMGILKHLKDRKTKFIQYF